MSVTCVQWTLWGLLNAAWIVAVVRVARKKHRR